MFEDLEQQEISKQFWDDISHDNKQIVGLNLGKIAPVFYWTDTTPFLSQ